MADAKRPRADKSRKGLGKVNVPRSETRRTNQRNGDRHRIDGRAAVVHSNGKDHQVELINLSPGGAMVEGPLSARMWDRVDLVLGEFGTVECAVRWIRGDRYGLEYAHETHIDCDADAEDELLRDVLRNCFPDVETSAAAGEPEEATDPDEVRRTKRHPLIWKGIVHHSYEWDVVRLRNISASGALIECSTTFPTGETVYLEVDRIGRLAARVCWSEAGQAGLAFETPFNLQRLSASAPEVTPDEWVQPEYLRRDEETSSPLADRWGRLTVSELKYTLRA
ncbi:MAG: PilZ domain-containing protein [Sphingomicrobium sp.]